MNRGDVVAGVNVLFIANRDLKLAREMYIIVSGNVNGGMVFSLKRSVGQNQQFKVTST